MVPYPSFADSQPFGHITDVEQTLGFGEKWRRFQEFEGWRYLTLDWAKKSFERIARRQSVGKNLNTSLVRRGFSKYPCHFLNGAIPSVRNCAKARRHYVQDNPTFGYAVKGSAVTDSAFVGRCCWSRDLRWGLRPSSSLSRSNIPLGSLAVLSA